MTHQEFISNFPTGSSVASPEGTYIGECVSYARQYMALVHGFKSGPIGHAADIATNSTFLVFYQKASSPQTGDIIIWGDDAGNWTSVYGHIGIVDTPGYMINQNFGGSREVSRNAIFNDGLIGYYRPKNQGGEMQEGIINDNDDIAELWRFGFFREPSAAELKNYQVLIGKYWSDAIKYLRQSDAGKQVKADYLSVPSLKSRITQLEGQGSELKPGTYIVK